MGGFLRQVAVLGALWALVELLLPEGNLHKAVRLIASLLVMAVLLSAMVDMIQGWLKPGTASITSVLGQVAAQSSLQVGEETTQPGYTHYVLQAQANQARAFCQRMAENAGYKAEATVYVTESGGLGRIELWLEASKTQQSPPLIEPDELREAIRSAFGAEDAQVKVFTDEGG